MNMIVSKMTLAAALTGVLALSACEPGPIGGNPNDPNAKTRNGALIGAGAGAVRGPAGFRAGDSRRASAGGRRVGGAGA